MSHKGFLYRLNTVGLTLGEDRKRITSRRPGYTTDAVLNISLDMPEFISSGEAVVDDGVPGKKLHAAISVALPLAGTALRVISYTNAIVVRNASSAHPVHSDYRE